MADDNILAMADRAARKPGFQLVSARLVEPEAVRWLWPHWLSLGKLQLLAGSPGTGKTTIAVSLAAAITAGAAWPTGGAGSARERKGRAGRRAVLERRGRHRRHAAAALPGGRR